MENNTHQNIMDLVLLFLLLIVIHMVINKYQDLKDFIGL